MKTEGNAASDVAEDLIRMLDPHKMTVGLDVWVQRKMRMVLFELAMRGYGRAQVISGKRTLSETERLYGIGRTEEELEDVNLSGVEARPWEKKVTWILPAFNRHVVGKAMDVDLTMYTALDFEAVAGIARCAGMIWGGEWSVRDTYHFEV